MPQREFWTARFPRKVTWSYICDPIDPEGPTALQVMVHDQAHEVMEARAVSIPADEAHEFVATLLHETWEGFLFGSEGAATRAADQVSSRFSRARVRRWLRDAKGD